MNIDDWRKAPWFAVEDDTIGGYAVALENKPVSMGPLYIGSFMDKAQAEHIADLHNAWLDEY